MQHVKTVKLNSLIEKPISGEWGDEGDSVKVLRSTNFTNDGFLNLSDVVTRNVTVKKIEQKQLRPGDTIIEKSGGSPVQPVGRVVYFDLTDGVYLCSNFTSIIRPKSEVVDRFLFWFLFNQHLVKNTLKYQNKTTGIINLQLARYLEDSIVNLSDLDTQRHIAAVLDKADALRQKDRQLLTYYEQLPQAVFLEIFGDEQAIKHRYEAINLCEVTSIVSGVTKNTKQTGTNYIDVPYMRVANVQDGRIDLSEIKTINVPPSDLQKFRLQRNDILLTEGGDPDKLGRGAVWHDEIANCIHQNHIFRVRPNQQLVNPTFLSFLIGSRYGKRYFLKAAKQTTGIASINMQQLKRFPAVVPSIDIQNQFSHAITEIEQQKKLAIAQLATSEALFQSLLHESFGIKA